MEGERSEKGKEGYRKILVTDRHVGRKGERGNVPPSSPPLSPHPHNHSVTPHYTSQEYFKVRDILKDQVGQKGKEWKVKEDDMCGRRRRRHQRQWQW